MHTNICGNYTAFKNIQKAYARWMYPLGWIVIPGKASEKLIPHCTRVPCSWLHTLFSMTQDQSYFIIHSSTLEAFTAPFIKYI